MNTLLQSLSRTCELIWEIALTSAEDTYKKVRGKATIYLKALAVSTFFCLTLILAFALLKAYTGITAFAYMAFIFMAIFALILGSLGLPIGTVLAMLKGHTKDPITAGNRYVRFVGILFFFELMATMYLVRVPMHHNTASILPFLMAATAVAVGSSIWGGLFSGKFYVFVAACIMLMMTLSFFAPETFGEISKKFDGLDSKLAKIVRGEQDYTGNTNSVPGFLKITKPKVERVRMPNGAKRIYVDYIPDEWIKVVFEPWHASFAWESTSDMQFKSSDGRIVNIPRNEWTSLGSFPRDIAGYTKIWIRGLQTSGRCVFMFGDEAKQYKLNRSASRQPAPGHSQSKEKASPPREQPARRQRKSSTDDEEIAAAILQTKASIDSAARAAQQPKRSALEILDSARAAQDSVNRALASRHRY